MINAQDLGERITRMFNFMYEVKGNYYILGQDYFRPCTDLEMGVYIGFKEALDRKEVGFIVEQYKRVRRYTSDSQPGNRNRDKEIVEFVQGLSEGDLESLNRQVDCAAAYAQIAYRNN